MPDFQFGMTSWGSPAATKRALLLHGLMGTGGVWFKVAEKLVAEGYRVDAPDLLGHGWAPHVSEYTPQTLAEHLSAHLACTQYDLLAGVSFGSSVAALLFTLLPSKPKRVLLAEPILDLPPFSDDAVKGMYNTTQSIPSEEDILKANPKWVPMEAVLRRMSLTQMDPKAITQLCESVARGEFNHDLLPTSSVAGESEIIILAADPAMRSIYPASNAELLKAKYPHVKFAQKIGATHDMHKDKPDVLVGILLNGLTKAKELELNVLIS